MLAHALIFSSVLSSVALRVVRSPDKDKYVDTSKCPAETNKTMWGIWIDGREADKGADVYGANYHAKLVPALNYISQLARGGPDANADIFVKIKEFLNTSYEMNRMEDRKAKYCMYALPKDKLNELTSTIKMNKVPWHADYKKVALEPMFADYAQKIQGSPGRHAEMIALADLLRNLAFLHPLNDYNGRSRMLITNYILRQRGLGCGTMMYNNGKNIYFLTGKEVAEMLEEGMQMYDKAAATQFAINPWQNEEMQNQHRAHFPTPQYMDKVGECWDKKYNTKKGKTHGSPLSF
eukprot:gnl/MRDRNA2_/MRDRNA2_88471_c0_seq1.p1 gnl/MRDRNA2_/MRDRNA2_88471_c0~~gnl/MRDRNA2_/MRDRNA2_88471_c0_seq1.p1  ORF type:complete len:293 (+),score=47.21 gnl/MRDRNA2_/MRDRNA2_88471_c0_seq1:115-993(+)